MTEPISPVLAAARSAVRWLDVDDGLSPGELGRCYEACQWSPSSYNGQTTRAVVRARDVVERLDFLTSTPSRF